jgi:hypothetical protein
MLPQTQGPEMEYSLFIMVEAMSMLMEFEEQPRSNPVAFPFSIFAELLCFMFLFDCRSFANAHMSSYI